jgi:uncharacterized protein (UPF0305 family)
MDMKNKNPTPKEPEEEWKEEFDLFYSSQIGFEKQFPHLAKEQWIKFISSLLSQKDKEVRKETLKELILEFEGNQLEGKGYDFYFSIRTKLDDLLKPTK